MPESHNREARGAQIISIRFRMRASADVVVARLLEVVRPTDVSLLKVFGDGDRVYPVEERNPALSASSWRAELYWGARAGLDLEDFLGRAERSLDCPGGVRLERGEGRRSLRAKVEG